MQLRNDTVGSMSPADRARTVLAAGAFLPWPIGESQVSAPYFVHGAAPVLLLDREETDQLLDIGRISVVLEHLPVLGTVMLSGWVQRVTDGERLALARHYRDEHMGCTTSCRAYGSETVAIELDQVRISVPDDRIFIEIDLDDYFAGEPDRIIAEGLGMTQHLNADHQHDLLQLAEALTGVPARDTIAASVDWIDAYGMDLAVIGVDGATAVRAVFRDQLTRISDLAMELHRMFNDPRQHFST